MFKNKILLIILGYILTIFNVNAAIIISGELSREINNEITTEVCINKEVNKINIQNINEIKNIDTNIKYDLYIKSDNEQFLFEGDNLINKSNIYCDENNLMYNVVLKINKENVIQTKSNESFNDNINLIFYKDEEIIENDNIILNLITSQIKINLLNIESVLLDNNINEQQTSVCIFGNGISQYNLKIYDQTENNKFYLVNKNKKEEKIEIKILYNNGKGSEEEILNNINSKTHQMDIGESCISTGFLKISYNSDIREKRSGFYIPDNMNGLLYILVSTIDIE